MTFIKWAHGFFGIMRLRNAKKIRILNGSCPAFRLTWRVHGLNLLDGDS
jgi:hypothetical protein